MTRRHRSAQQLASDALIDLYQIDTTKYGGGISCWTPGPMGEAAGNVIWNPRCRSNTNGWSAEATPTHFGASLALALGVVPALYRLPEGSGFVQYPILTANATRTVTWTDFMNVVPGQILQAQAQIHPLGCKMRVGLQFWNASISISNSWSAWQPSLSALGKADQLQDFRSAWLNATAPAGATRARLLIQLAPEVDGSASASIVRGHWTRAMLVACAPSGRAHTAPLEFAPGARVGSVSFAGQLYTPLPVRFEGVQRTGRGPVPRITLVIPDIESFGTALLLARGNLLGCPVNRRQVFRHALDDGENPDASDFFGPEIFYVDRVARWVPGVEIALECASPLDVQGTMLPARQVIADVCGLTYRAWNGSSFTYGSCPYAGGAYFDAANNSTASAAADVCSKSLAGCRKRYGSATPLPAFMFPGASRGRY